MRRARSRRFRSQRPILAVGADLKNTITLVVDGQAFVSQHIGDLDHYEVVSRVSAKPFDDLISMYEFDWDDLLVVHDAHPQYRLDRCTRWSCAALRIARGAASSRAHRVGARGARRLGEARPRRQLRRHRLWRRRHDLGRRIFRRQRARVSIAWRICARASLAGGDAAAQHPVQAAAGFLAQIDGLPDLTAPTFRFPERYQQRSGADPQEVAHIQYDFGGPPLRYRRRAAGFHAASHV